MYTMWYNKNVKEEQIMATALDDIHVRVEPKLKKESIKVLNELGVSMSDFVTMNLRQVVRDKTIHFEIDENDPKLPENMRIKTKEEFYDYIDKAIDYNEKHPKTYTIEESKALLKKV